MSRSKYADLCIYRVKIMWRGKGRVMRVAGWSDADALDRATRRLDDFAQPYDTINILDRQHLPGAN